MKLKKFTALAMLTAMCATTIYGCSCSSGDSGDGSDGGSADEPMEAELLVWCPAEDQSSGWIQEMCEQFDEEHPEWDITFRYETCSEGDADKNITTDPTVAGDIYFFANDQLTTLLNADALSKLGGETADYVKNTNDPSIVASVTRNGNIYGIPFTANTWFMYYDKSAYTEEDIKSLDTMLQKGVVSFPITDSWYFASFYAAGGGVFNGEDGSDASAGVVLGDNATAVTEYLIDLVNNKNFVKDEGGSGLSGLADNSVDAYFSGTWKYEDVKKALGDNMGIAQLPSITINGEAMQLKSFSGSKCIGVNPHCDNPQIAVSLAKYLASEEAQKEHYEARRIIPSNTELLDDDEIMEDALAQAQINTIRNTSIVQPMSDSFNENYWDNAVAFANAIIDGTVNKDNAAEKTAELENAWNGRRALSID